jgi:hypothetical protein
LFNSEERATNTHTNRAINAINAHRAVAAAVCRREKVLSSSMDVFFRDIGSASERERNEEEEENDLN